MKLLRLEFFKCRRRKILLVCAAVLAAELLWLVSTFLRQDAEDLRQGWMLLLYNLAMVDAIIMPISVATIASRNCELEHKGTTLKLLETMAAPGQLYGAKLTWGALVLATLLMGPVGALHGGGHPVAVPGEVPWGRFGIFTLISWAVSMMVYALQQGLSLRFQTRRWPWCAGSPGAFSGYYPPVPAGPDPLRPLGLLRPFVPGGDELGPDTRFTWFYWEWPAPTDARSYACGRHCS